VLFGETPNELDASPFSSEEQTRVKRKLLGAKSHRPRTERVPDEKRIIFNDHVYSARSRERYRRVGPRIKMARGLFGHGSSQVSTASVFHRCKSSPRFGLR
jgi:hypothetical protein